MTLIAQIQAQYPDAIGADDAGGMADAYCIGGAIVMFAQIAWEDAEYHSKAFPNTDDLGDALRTLNPALALEQADDFADQIIETCDEGRLGDAWAIAAQALPL
jgi:hypothetical protein